MQLHSACSSFECLWILLHILSIPCLHSTIQWLTVHQAIMEKHFTWSHGSVFPKNFITLSTNYWGKHLTLPLLEGPLGPLNASTLQAAALSQLSFWAALFFSQIQFMVSFQTNASVIHVVSIHTLEIKCFSVPSEWKLWGYIDVVTDNIFMQLPVTASSLDCLNLILCSSCCLCIW